ncbi:MAG TPA: hypothetical protein PKE68_13025 [Saprospiraceae bacterium]|nr:hypothetical protein [Saprospiraceae bacterium]
MSTHHTTERSPAQEARAAIERLYIAMRHLFIRGSYKPLGVSGQAMIDNLKILRPEIYGDITDSERVELEGLLYVFQRLPKGIEECRYIRLISREGFEKSDFETIIPPKRRRNCYRIDEEQMFIEMTRGRSDIYDILTHLTFMYIEAEKIRRNSEDQKERKRREWKQLEKIVLEKSYSDSEFNREVAFTYLSTLLGRTYDETMNVYRRFATDEHVNNLFHITYWLGRLSSEEMYKGDDREISFSSALRERIGHHHYGAQWANSIKNFLAEKGWLQRPIHIISANPHSVMNCLYANIALQRPNDSLEDLARELSLEHNSDLRERVQQYALQHGMYQFDDTSGTNITVQIFDTTALPLNAPPTEIAWQAARIQSEQPLLFVMDYAFGEQAFETMDELLKPYESNGSEKPLPIASIAIMGKAGILEGAKGDIMIPTAHVFEGTADNYPLDNDLSAADFEYAGLPVYEGPMITVLGTSLQNKDILYYFLKSSWRIIGLEMEGAHYQKAIQAATRIRRNIRTDVVIRYAYYASDNPLITGHTLASGSLGLDGVKPTYLITLKILNKILG